MLHLKIDWFGDESTAGDWSGKEDLPRKTGKKWKQGEGGLIRPPPQGK